MQKTCLIILSFGMGKGIGNYGTSNEALAKIAAEINLPIIAQWEIANLLIQLGKTPNVRIDPAGGAYVDSYAVLEAAKLSMEDLGYQDAILFGHKDHLPRIRMMAKRLGIKLSNRKIVAEIPYDKKSSQWWTRNRFSFLSREILVYILSFLKGQI